MNFRKLLPLLRAKLKIPGFRKLLLHYALKGDMVECPCCGSKYITFLPAGLDFKRPNAKCVNCGSLERHRNLSLFFSDNSNMFNSYTKLLHVAPEKAFYNYFNSQKNIDYYPIDLEPHLYQTKEMDLTKLDYSDNYFEAVICSHVLEHITDDIKAMLEIYRVLKNGGWAILNVPLNNKTETTWEDSSIDTPEKRRINFGQSDHVRIYGRDYVDRLKEVGFKVEVIRYSSKFNEKQIFRYGLREKELIYLCHK